MVSHIIPVKHVSEMYERIDSDRRAKLERILGTDRRIVATCLKEVLALLHSGKADEATLLLSCAVEDLDQLV
jgi:hypothetical protein